MKIEFPKFDPIENVQDDNSMDSDELYNRSFTIRLFAFN